MKTWKSEFRFSSFRSLKPENLNSDFSDFQNYETQIWTLENLNSFFRFSNFWFLKFEIWKSENMNSYFQAFSFQVFAYIRWNLKAFSIHIFRSTPPPTPACTKYRQLCTLLWFFLLRFWGVFVAWETTFRFLHVYDITWHLESEYMNSEFLHIHAYMHEFWNLKIWKPASLSCLSRPSLASLYRPLSLSLTLFLSLSLSLSLSISLLIAPLSSLSLVSLSISLATLSPLALSRSRPSLAL